MKRVLILSAAALIVFALFLPLEFRYLKASDFPQNLLYLLLFNLNLTALGTLIYFVIKGFFELYTGLKRKTLGLKFQAKILFLFTLLTLIPAILIYVFASGLAGNYMDTLFNAQFKKPLETSVKIATAVYEKEKARALAAAEDLARNPAGADSYRHEGYDVYVLPDLGAEATPALKAAFVEKRAQVETISRPSSISNEGDIIRAAVPYGQGALVVNTVIPAELTGYIEEIQRANEGYIKLESWRGPLRGNFYMILGFIAMTIMFTALLASLRLAKGITGPVGELARATEEVARGNLDLKVPHGAPDEMGMLVDSFNKMVGELREGKLSLEKAYMESDRRRLLTEGILDNIRSGVIALSPEGTVSMINPEACRILGIEAGEVLGQPYDVVLGAIRSEEFRKYIKGINLRTITQLERDFWLGVAGKKALLRVSIQALRDAKRRHMGVLVVFDELTELVKAQRAIAWQEVARRIAHEIKNPLTPIKLSTERMMKKWHEGHEDFPQAFERSTKTIISEVEGLRRLVDEFSRFGKMPEVKKEPSDLVKLLEEVQNLYRPYKKFRLLVDCSPGIPLVDLDPEQFKRALVNLIDNARQAMGDDGEVQVKIEPEPGLNRVYIKVADTGPGIPDEMRDRLFQPYFSTKRDGTGLGLAIVHKIVSEHNGYIRVGENEPRGSVFTIEMPIREI